MTTRDPYPSSAYPTSPQGTTGTIGHQGGAEEGTSSTVEQTKEKAGEVVDQTKEKAGQLVEQATEQAKPRLEQQKERAAGSLSTTAQALRQTGEQLRGQQEGPVAQVAERAAAQVERVSGYLRQRDINQLISEAEDFARRQPALFLGGAFALGVLGARFLKSSGQQASQGRGGQGRGQRAGTAAMQDFQRTGYRPGVIASSGVATLPDATAVWPGPASATVPPLSAEGALAETAPMGETEVRPGYSPAQEAR